MQDDIIIRTNNPKRIMLTLSIRFVSGEFRFIYIIYKSINGKINEIWPNNEKNIKEIYAPNIPI
tara:strand:+ start:1412 stop:1603 length:192 start_codon:yes stop_codon:yes gene_type:complete